MAEGLPEYLRGHRDAGVDAGRVDTGQLQLWLRDLDASSRAGVRKAWLVGRALNVERDKLEYGEVERWEEKQALAPCWMHRNVARSVWRKGGIPIARPGRELYHSDGCRCEGGCLGSACPVVMW